MSMSWQVRSDTKLQELAKDPATALPQAIDWSTMRLNLNSNMAESSEDDRGSSANVCAGERKGVPSLYHSMSQVADLREEYSRLNALQARCSQQHRNAPTYYQ